MIGRVEAVVAQRTEYALYSSVSGQPVERSKMKRDMVSFANSQAKASNVLLNCL